MEEKRKQNVRGITLIALVITVIVLLILAGAAVSMALNEKDIFAKSNTAKTEWNAKVEEEDTRLDNYKNYLELEIPDDIDVGSIVNWTPTGYYRWDKNIYANDDGIGTNVYISGETEFTQNFDTATKELYSVASNEEKNTLELVNSWTSGNKLDFTISKWKVLSVDKTNKTVKIVPKTVTIPVTLESSSGYNNGVKLLNDACSSLYGGDLLGVEVHNINMNDIEALMLVTDAEDDPLNIAKSTTPAYEERYTNNTGYTSYRNATGEYIKNVSYPTIYAEERLRKIKNNDNTVDESNEGLGLSEARSSFISREDAVVTKTAANGIVTKTVSTIHPAKTDYILNNEDFTAKLGENIASVLLPNGGNTYYWVASRCVEPRNDYCSFNMRVVAIGGLYSCVMDSSGIWIGSRAFGLFPIVTLSSGVLSEENGEYIYSPIL